MKARYRYRVYPTNKQKIALAQLFGCCRVVWNDALAYCQESYNKGKKYPGKNYKDFLYVLIYSKGTLSTIPPNRIGGLSHILWKFPLGSLAI